MRSLPTETYTVIPFDNFEQAKKEIGSYVIGLTLETRRTFIVQMNGWNENTDEAEFLLYDEDADNVQVRMDITNEGSTGVYVAFDSSSRDVFSNPWDYETEGESVKIFKTVGIPSGVIVKGKEL